MKSQLYLHCRSIKLQLKLMTYNYEISQGESTVKMIYKIVI